MNNYTHIYKEVLSRIVVLVMMLFALVSSAEDKFSQKVTLTQLNMSGGLPHNYVDDILKDSKGFVWIATNGGGLCRYDGYGVKTFDISTKINVSSNFVHQLAEDQNERLWIASDGGVDILDLRQQAMVKSELVNEDLLEKMSRTSKFVRSDANGVVWYVCDKTIYAAVANAGGKTVDIVEYESNDVVTALGVIGDNVWYASGSNMYRLGLTGNRITSEKMEMPEGVDFAARKYMITVFFRKDNDLWIGTDGGLCRYNPLNGMYKVYVSNPQDPTSLSQNRITDIAETQSHEIIVATLKGINIYNPMTDNFEQVTQDTPIAPKGMSSNFVNCLMADGDMLWMGTEIGGADILIPNELLIKNYAHNTSRSSIAPNPVNSIVEDREGNLWIGSVESGISIKKPGTATFEHLTVANALPHNSISAMDIDGENHLWAGTWGNGVCVIDLNRKSYPVIRVVEELAGKYVGAVVADKTNNGVWVTTTDTIYFIGETVKTPFKDPRVNNMGGSIGGAIDDQGKLWLGTEGGLLIADITIGVHDNMYYEVIDTRLDNPNEAGKPRVSYIYKAKDGTMYVGTNGYGLCYKRPGDEKFNTVTIRDGLSNNIVKGIAEDAHGDIWISTYRGLSVFDVRNEKVACYSTADGLLDDNFYWNAAYVSPSTGLLYFGTLSGLTEVRRRLPSTEKEIVSGPTITALRILNEDVESANEWTGESVSYAKRMCIHERDKSFTVEFSALNYRSPKSVQYSYKLNGFDSHWIDVSPDRRIATYTNLPAGEYELQIRSTDGHGNWSDMTKLAIEVSPFFYKTLWFYIFMLTIMGVIIWQIFRYRVKTLKEQRRLLNMLVKERTEELERQNETLESQKHILEENTRELEEKSEELEMQKETLEMQKKILEDNTKELEEKSEELEQQNNILGDQNIQITRQKDSIEQMAEKIQKLSFDKLQFFTNISHEIRTPITLIMGPTKRALGMTEDPKLIEQLKLVEKSSHNLLEIVNQLMDFRKIETENMELKPTSEKIVPFVKDIVHPFAVYASERNIRVECLFRMKSEIIQFDTDALNKVLTNLLSNAIKYTNDSGVVTVYMTTLVNDGKQNLYMCVRDTGDGIPDDEMERIFESYYQSDNHKKAYVYGQTGTGIGLYLCRKLVEMAGGRIWAKNNQSKGCSMRILVPYEDGELAVDNEENKIEEDIDEIEMQEEKKHILVVEDNKDMRVYIRSILEGLYEVYEAQNGVEGLTVLAENDIDFIICDLMMPVMDGLEFAKKVKSNFSFSHVHILMLTAQLADSYRTESYKIGVESYLHKPFDEQMLLARISGILASRKENQQRFQYSLNTDDLNIDRESEDEKFVKQVLELVEKNYKDSEYSIDDILKSMCCSKSMLNKKMQNVIGQSPGVFIRSYRLNMAKQLILLNRKTKSMNISQIAYDVGFNDPKYFTRCFTKYFCVTPSVLMEGSDSEEDVKE